MPMPNLDPSFELGKRLSGMEQRVRSLETKQAAAVSAVAVNVGSGGLTVTGPTTLSGGTTVTGGESVDNLTVTGALNATLSGNVNGPGTSTFANVSTSGQVISAGVINSPGTKANAVTSGYSVMYIDSAGNMGGSTSSRRFKQDIEPVVTDTPGFLGLTTYRFRYIAAVEELGDDAPWECGLIAEEVEKVAPWACFYEDDGVTVRGINYDRLVVSLLGVAQDHERRIRAIEG